MFEGIIGNSKIKEELEKNVQNQNISHSYMFIGTEGIGKKMIAKEFAKMVMCLDEKKYCNKCKSCIEFNTNNHPDYLYIEPDGKNIKIDQIRMLQRKIQERPIISEKKVYIINDADKMNTEAQNCLLKTLEEPPEYAVIILIGVNENAFLNTVKSRCLVIKFQEIDNIKIKEYMNEQYGLVDISDNMVQMFQGSIGKAISLKEKQEDYEKIEKILLELDKRSIIDILNMSEILYKSKEDINDILEYINIALLRFTKENFKYVNCINIVEETKRRLKQNANYDMCIDNMIFNMWEEVN